MFRTEAVEKGGTFFVSS